MTARILLVEDNVVDARLLQRRFRDRPDITFDVTQTMGDAIDRLSSGTYELIVLDACLPDARPHDTVSRIMEHAGDIPIILLTGMDEHARRVLDIPDSLASFNKDAPDADGLVAAIHAALAPGP